MYIFHTPEWLFSAASTAAATADAQASTTTAAATATATADVPAAATAGRKRSWIPLAASEPRGGCPDEQPHRKVAIPQVVELTTWLDIFSGSSARSTKIRWLNIETCSRKSRLLGIHLNYWAVEVLLNGACIHFLTKLNKGLFIHY